MHEFTMDNDEPVAAWQSDSYDEARQNFLAVCAAAGATVVSYLHPLTNTDGDGIYTDVARFGPDNASKLLVMISGVHGVEGFSGSATQVGWIAQRRYEYLPDDTAVLMVHLINPWGVAHLRRYNEDNVDLCRNFVDFSQPLPGNPAYADIHAELVLGDTLGANGEKVAPYLGKMVGERGLEYVVDLFMAGQYQYPQGFSFGGNEPTWSNKTLREILTTHASGITRVCVIEFHTGLGPWGYGQVITMHHDEELQRVRDWFGPWVFNPSADRAPGEEGYRVVPGHTIECYRSCFPEAQLSAVTMEFGTYPPNETLALLIQEHLQIHSPEDVSNEQSRATKEKLLEYHHPQSWEWRCAFWSRSLQIIRQAFKGLAN
jgi:hypothetical protein